MLVEAAGVEPASENSGSQATTCLALHTISSDFCLESRDQSRTSLCGFRSPRRDGARTLSSHHDARIRRREQPTGERRSQL